MRMFDFIIFRFKFHCIALCPGSRFKCPWHGNEPYVKPCFLRMSCCNNLLSSSLQARKRPVKLLSCHLETSTSLRPSLAISRDDKESRYDTKSTIISTTVYQWDSIYQNQKIFQFLGTLSAHIKFHC